MSNLMTEPERFIVAMHPSKLDAYLEYFEKFKESQKSSGVKLTSFVGDIFVDPYPESHGIYGAYRVAVSVNHKQFAMEVPKALPIGDITSQRLVWVRAVVAATKRSTEMEPWKKSDGGRGPGFGLTSSGKILDFFKHKSSHPDPNLNTERVLADYTINISDFIDDVVTFAKSIVKRDEFSREIERVMTSDYCEFAEIKYVTSETVMYLESIKKTGGTPVGNGNSPFGKIGDKIKFEVKVTDSKRSTSNFNGHIQHNETFTMIDNQGFIVKWKASKLGALAVDPNRTQKLVGTIKSYVKDTSGNFITYVQRVKST